MLKIASWNVNSLRVRLPHVLDWLQKEVPDVLALQEIKMLDNLFPFSAFQELGYHSICTGQKTYNGVALISKKPLSDIQSYNPFFADDENKRFIAGTVNDCRIVNVYVPNGAAVDSDKYPYKLKWLSALKDYLTHELIKYPKLVVLGDFNIAPEDRDVHEPALWQDGILVSPPERQAFQDLINVGLKDVFRLFPQPEKLFSWWDYRALAFQRNCGLRIDLILASTTLSALCEQSIIDKAPRKLKQPSDHAPIYAIFKN